MSFWNRATGGAAHQVPVLGDYADYDSASISSDGRFSDGEYYEDEECYEEKYDNGEIPLPEGPPPTENVFQNVASPPLQQRKMLPASLHQYENSPVLQIARKRPVDPVLAQNPSTSMPPSGPGNSAPFYTPLQSPVLEMSRKRLVDPILQQKLASMQAPFAGGEQTPFRTPLQSPGLGGGRKRPVRLSNPGTPLVSPRQVESRNKLVSPLLRPPIVSPGGTIKMFYPSTSTQNTQTVQGEESEEPAVAPLGALSIKPLDESSDDSELEFDEKGEPQTAVNATSAGPAGDTPDPDSATKDLDDSCLRNEQSFALHTEVSELGEDLPSDSDSGRDENIVEETIFANDFRSESSTNPAEHDEDSTEILSDVDDNGKDLCADDESEKSYNELDEVDDCIEDEADHGDPLRHDEEPGSHYYGQQTDFDIRSTTATKNGQVQNEIVEYDELLAATPTREQRSPHFVFLSDQKNVPSELKRLQEKTRRRRRDLRNQFHDLECQLGLAASKFAEEKMDLGLAIRDTFDRTCCRPLEVAVERVAMERETTDRRHDVAELDKQVSRLSSQMMRHVHVTLSDAKREQLDCLRQDLLQEVVPSMRIEKSKADKIEGGVVRRYELNAGNVAKRLHQESASRRAALDAFNRKVRKMFEQEEQRSNDVLDVIGNLREQIRMEREERIAADKQIMDDITRTAVAMRRAFLAAFDDSTN